MTRTIPQHIADAYVARYPHLAILARAALGGSLAATRSFSQNALRLEAPPGVTAADVWQLSAFTGNTP